MSENLDWTKQRLNRLNYMLMNGFHHSLLLESFMCDVEHLKLGKALLKWQKQGSNGATNTKHI